jgi:hypothetical protein
MQDLNALLNIVVPEPDWDKMRDIANQLWLGEMTWREFVDALMTTHLSGGNAMSTTSEHKGTRSSPFVSSLAFTIIHFQTPKTSFIH